MEKLLSSFWLSYLLARSLQFDNHPVDYFVQYFILLNILVHISLNMFFCLQQVHQKYPKGFASLLTFTAVWISYLITYNGGYVLLIHVGSFNSLVHLK